MMKKGKAKVVLVSLFLTFFCFLSVQAQNENQFAQVLYDSIEITGENFKKFLGLTPIPVIQEESSSGIPTWIWFGGGGLGVGVITYVLLTNDNSSSSLIANNDNVTIPCNGSGSINVLANDTGDNINFVNFSTSSSSQVTHNGNGELLIQNVGTSSFTISYSIEDEDGNQASAQVNVMITSPQFLPQDDQFTYQPGPNELGNVLTNDIGDGLQVVSYSTAANGEVSILNTGDLFYLPNTDFCGTENITYQVQDVCGIELSVNLILIGSDEEGPVISCPPAVTVDCGADLDPDTTGLASATDNCSEEDDINISYSDDMSGLTLCNGTGAIFRTWTAVDAQGNESVCVQTISIEDVSPPSLTCPADISITCGSDYSPDVAGFAQAEDLCGASDVSYEDDLTGLTNCSNTGLILREWTAIDSCGNESICVQTITVLEDQEVPVITCPAEATINCGDVASPEITGMATATDNCSSPDQISITYTDGEIDSTACNPTFIRTWSATDSCMNVASCDQTIVMQDQSDPTISCPSDITIQCTLLPEPNITGTPTVEEDCIYSTLTFEDEVEPNGPCAATVTRTWTATDNCGNTSTCLQTITLEEINCDFTYLLIPTNASCGAQNGTATMVVSPGQDAVGPFAVLWSDGQTGDQASNLGAGNYQVTIIDAGINCNQVADFQIGEDPPNIIQNLEVIPETCSSFGNVIFDIQSPGAGPMDINIFLPGGGFVSVPNYPNNSTFILSDWIANPPPGPYQFEITDQAIGNSCTQNIMIDIPQAQPINIFLEVVIPPSTPTGNDGQIFINVDPSSGVLPFDVYVNGQLIGTVNSFNFIINNVQSGVYNIFIIDAVGCISNTLEVFVPIGGILMTSLNTDALAWPNDLLIKDLEHPNSLEEVDVDFIMQQNIFVSKQFPLKDQLSFNVDFNYLAGKWNDRALYSSLEGQFTSYNIRPSIRWIPKQSFKLLPFIQSGLEFNQTKVLIHDRAYTNSRTDQIGRTSLFLNLGLETKLNRGTYLTLQTQWSNVSGYSKPHTSILFRKEIGMPLIDRGDVLQMKH